jgi:hypothetical protein
MPLPHPQFGWDQTTTGISSLEVLFVRSRGPPTCFWYISVDNRNIAGSFWGNHYRKGGCIQGDLECKDRGLAFEQWVAPSSNTSSIGCLDDPGIEINQVQFCGYENPIRQVFGPKWRVPNSTPYPLRPIDNHSSWSRLSIGWMNRVGGGVPENGG